MENNVDVSIELNFHPLHSLKEKFEDYFHEVGGKAYNLLRLLKNGFKAPGGFLVTTSIFKRFITENLAETNLEKHIKKNLGMVHSECSLEDIANVSNSIVEEVKNRAKSSQIVKTLKALLEKEIDSRKNYSIRSSGVAEDLEEASFAGQLKTSLNVRGADVDKIMEKIIECWNSVFSVQALVYRIVNNLNNQEEIPFICVIIQEMVESVYAAGVLFTAHPVTSRRDMMLINCSYGLGEAIVGGKVNVDSFEVSRLQFEASEEQQLSQRHLREKFVISERTISEKKIEMKADTDKGMAIEREVGPERSTKATVSDDMVVRLAALGEAIEKSYGGVPQDIEFAISSDKQIHVLQSRPITNLLERARPIVGFHEEEESSYDYDVRRVYICINHMQVVSRPFSPMGMSIIMGAFGDVFFNDELLRSRFYINGHRDRFVVLRGRLYVDLTDLFSSGKVAKLITTPLSSGVDAMMGKAVSELIFEREYLSRRSDGPKLSPVKIAGVLLAASKFATKMLRKVFRAADVEAAYLYFGSLYEEFKKEVDKAKNDVEKVERAARVSRAPFFPRTFDVVSGGNFSMAVLLKLLKDKGELLQRYTGGIFLNSKEMEMSLHKCSVCLAKLPTLLEKVTTEKDHLSSIPTEDALKEIRSWVDEIEGVEVFVEALENFLEEYGCRGVVEIDVRNPRNSDSLAFVLNVILSNSNNAKVENENREELIADSIIAENEIIEEVSIEGRLSFLNVVTLGLANHIKERLFKNLLRTARAIFRFRETPKHCVMQRLAYTRKVLLDIAERKLVPRSILSSKTDVFFLYHCELVHIMKHLTELSEEKIHQITRLVEKRKDDFTKWEKMHAPRVTTDKCEDVEISVRKKLSKDLHLPEGVHLGSGVSAGEVTGPVAVILDPTKETMPEGHIIVAEMIDPAFSVLFKNCIGMVSSVGGHLTHGSIVAREQGLPAVVGVTGCVRIFKNGDIVTVNGSDGTVRMVEEKKRDDDETRLEDEEVIIEIE